MVKKKLFDISGFDYRPVRYEEIVAIYERVQNRLIEIGCDDSQLYENLNKIFSNMKRLLEQADKSCCGQVQANGFYSFGRLIFKFLECLDKESEKERHHHGDHKQFIETFTQLSDVLRTMNQAICYLLDDLNLEDETKLKELEQELLKYPQLHRRLEMFKQVMVTKHVLDDPSFRVNSKLNGSYKLQNFNKNLDKNYSDNQVTRTNNNSFSRMSNNSQFNSLPLFSPHLKTIFDSIYETIMQPNTPHKDIIFREQFMFWLDSGLASFFKLYIFILPFLRVRLYKYPHLLFGSKFRSKVLNKITTVGVSQQFPFEFWNSADLKYKTRNTRTKSRAIHIPTQNSIEINQSLEGGLTINDTNEIKFNRDVTVRCKYIKPKNIDIEKCDRLMIHLHGGGFFSQSCDSHEIYLRHWVYYNEIPILTVDYKVKRAFPAGLQDSFDVYLWLRQAPEQEVKSKLGFFPKTIVITGDSAGGNFGLGITLALNDLRNEKSEFKIPIALPDGLVLIYAPFLINASVSPSRCFSTLDTLVPLAVQLVIMYGISGLIPGLRPNTSFEALKTYLFPFQDPKPWFVCDSKDVFNDRCTFLSKNITSPYLTPLFYEKYSSLTDTPIHLISAEYCSFLDESVTLAKIYKGPVKFDVIQDMCHGFLNLKFVGKRVSNATMFCCQKVSDMFDLVDPKNSPTVSAKSSS